MDENEEAVVAEASAVVGRSTADQMSAQLTDLADTLVLYVARLNQEGGFSKPESKEMAREWYTRYLWHGTSEECDCDE